MLVYYTLTAGTHPYGQDKFDIQMNMSRGWPVLKHVTNEADDLINKMLSSSNSDKPTIGEAVRHVFFIY